MVVEVGADQLGIARAGEANVDRPLMALDRVPVGPELTVGVGMIVRDAGLLVAEHVEEHGKVAPHRFLDDRVVARRGEQHHAIGAAVGAVAPTRGGVQLVTGAQDDADIREPGLDEIVALEGQHLLAPDAVHPAIGRDLPDASLLGRPLAGTLVAGIGRRAAAVQMHAAVHRRGTGRPGLGDNETPAAAEWAAGPLEGAGPAGLEIELVPILRRPASGPLARDVAVGTLGLEFADQIDGSARRHQAAQAVEIGVAAEPERQAGLRPRAPADAGGGRPAHGAEHGAGGRHRG